jgi:membrane-bound lytic murein transglycosylase D
MRTLLSPAVLIAFGCAFLPSCPAGAQNLVAPGSVSSPVSDEVLDRLPPREPELRPSARPPQWLGDALHEAATPAQRALRAAERLFLHGRFLIQEGKPEEARRVFDEAVDALLALPEDEAGREQIEKRAEELIRRIRRHDLEDLGAGEPPELLPAPSSPLEQILDLALPADPAARSRSLERVRLGASQLPLTVNDAVLDYINYFSGPKGSRILLHGLRRSGRYRQMIERILDEEGVPRELMHLAQAESAFQPRAVSRARAVGLWQFIPSRGAEYGLEAGKTRDDRMDPEKATRAAARHLRDLYQQTGDWYLAMAAYNCGPMCVERAVQRTGYADFWELRARQALPRETMNYVPAILAMAIIAQNPRHYGLPAIDAEDPLEFDTIRLETETSLALLADAAETTVSEIRELNPGLLGATAPAGQEVRVPRGAGRSVLAALDLVPEDKRKSARLHRLNSGETVAAIARRFGSSPAQIAALNEIERMEEGSLVVVPVTAAPAASVRKTAGGKAARPGAGKTGAAARRKAGGRPSSVRAAAREAAPKAAPRRIAARR